jgi:heptosyltransferase II
MISPKKILLFHTAFIGDIILALPLAQALRAQFPGSTTSFVATPAASTVLRNHPAIDEIIPYDKKGEDRGLGGLLGLAAALRRRHFDLAIIPHRSLRSAAIPWLAGIPRRVGFATSAAPVLLTDRVPYRRDQHESVRNLDLLGPLDAVPVSAELPRLYPNEEDREIVQSMLTSFMPGDGTFDSTRLVAVAPGSVWNTKRWPVERYRELCRMLLTDGYSIVLIGGKEDAGLCGVLAQGLENRPLLNTAGTLSLLQSAEMIRRCRAAVSNDSAPMHLAVGVGTPVVAIFGATVPRFGFAPTGPADRVLGVEGLSCRPCGIHGGDVCPVGSFACMLGIGPGEVRQAVSSIVGGQEVSR